MRNNLTCKSVYKQNIYGFKLHAKSASFTLSRCHLCPQEKKKIWLLLCSPTQTYITILFLHYMCPESKNILNNEMLQNIKKGSELTERKTILQEI